MTTTFTPLDDREIAREHEAGASLRSIAMRRGVSHPAIRQAVLRAGGVPRTKQEARNLQRRLSAADEDAMVARHQAGERPPALARAFGISPDWVCRILKKRDAFRPKPKKVSDLDKATIIALHQQGVSSGEIASRFGTSSTWIQIILRKAGFNLSGPDCSVLTKRRQQFAARFEGSGAIRRYQSGESVESICEEAGCSISYFYKALRRLGIPLRPLASRPKRERSCTLNEAAFDAINEHSAYWIGFLLADGGICDRDVGQPSVALTLSDEDAAHVLKFRDFLGSSHKVVFTTAERAGGFHSEHGTARLAVVSTRLVNVLSLHGVVPRKSKQERLLLLGDDPNAWRGIIDGDGSVGWTTEQRSRPCPRVSLACGRPLIEQFAAFVYRLAPGCRARPRHTEVEGFWQFSTAGEHAVRVIRALYGNCTVALDRKLAIAREAMKWVRKIASWKHLTIEEIDRLISLHGTVKLAEASLGMRPNVLKAVRKRLQRKAAL